jgi:hypothetical protein
MDRVDIEPAARDQPGDHRVRVPHLADPQLIASPDRRRHLGHQLEQAPRAVRITTEALRTLDRLGHVGDHAVTPTLDLVAEEPEATCSACPDRALGDDATLSAVARSDRCLFDHEPSLRQAHLECRVVEVAAIAPFEPRRQRLEDAPVQANRVATCAERQPVQVDAGDHRRRRHRTQRSPAL